MELAGFADGTYRVKFWDTYTGRVTRTGEARATAGTLRFAVPAIERDAAVKILYKNGK
ncbi:MAG: hypothetical protein HZC54_17510 [Verrucomicrobia bacterium]|nr:hypothetical protein [Verrucomicrobiota bacterium]